MKFSRIRNRHLYNFSEKIHRTGKVLFTHYRIDVKALYFDVQRHYRVIWYKGSSEVIKTLPRAFKTIPVERTIYRGNSYKILHSLIIPIIGKP